ncbi:MAG: hypothetical protein ACR2HJ_01445 [Fimbriimonadales bacterium]
MPLSEWTVDYGEGPKPVTLPHVWGEEVDLRWEGPAVYRRVIGPGSGHLVFHGVSAHARVFIGDELRAEHLGLWDAFSVPVVAEEPVEVRVEVVKNGGPRFPVSSVASGFLPHVFGTFGGIHKDVEWVAGAPTPQPAAPVRTSVEGPKLYVDGKPTFIRGLLHWGWYPDLRHPNPSRERCLSEARAAQDMGFNLVKFCLWAPPHEYLDALDELGMFGWMELPVWNPGSRPEDVAQTTREIERIVLQYRHHPAIILWTIGCELGSQMSRSDRRSLFGRVKELSGGALVKDSSGGAEMYGGDPAEFGDFEDFHPYCDLAHFPAVLDALAPGPRSGKLVLFGECNDFDVHRDLPRIAAEKPYWSSADPKLNDKGVRWQYDLPDVIDKFSMDEERHRKLMESSRGMKLFAHRMFQEWLRSRDSFAGSVITGWADTPISSSGWFDDWGSPRFAPEETRGFMGPDVLFLVPSRRFPWLTGGNRASSSDAWHHFTGQRALRVGLHSEDGLRGIAHWRLILNGAVAAEGEEDFEAARLVPCEVANVRWEAPTNACGNLEVEVRAGSEPIIAKSWPITVVSPEIDTNGWTLLDRSGMFDGTAFGGGPNLVSTELPADWEERVENGSRLIVFASEGPARPAFREAAYEFPDPKYDALLGGRWPTLLMTLGDRTLDPAVLPEGAEPLLLRIDTRTYEELPVAVRVRRGEGEMIVTTLRAYGGFGFQPPNLLSSPAGTYLLRGLLF